MADPVEIILEFLQRNQFAQAEAAFKAELLTRSKRSCTDLLSETVLGWDLQLRSTTANNLDGGVLNRNRSGNSANEHMAIVDSERRLHASDKTFPRPSDSERKEHAKKLSTGRTRSPAEKQLYVEYESSQSKSQELLPLVCQDYAFLNSRTLSESLGRVCFGAGQVNSPTDNCESTMQGLSWRGLSNAAQWPSLASSMVTSLQPFLSEHGQKDPSEPESAQVDFQPVWPKETGSDFDSVLMLEDADQVLRKTEVQRSNLANDELMGPQSTFDMGMGHVSSNSVKRQEFRSSQEEVEVGGSKFFALKALSDSEKIKLCEAGCGALQHHNGFLPRSIREGLFKEPILKTSFPLSVTKFSHKNDNQRSTIPDYMDYGNEKDAAVYSWNDNELQKFEAKDPVSSYRAADKALFFNSQELIANRQSVEETLPRLPPVRVHLDDKNMDTFKDGGCAVELENATRNIASAAFNSMASTPEERVGWGMLENGSVGQDMSALGFKRAVSRPSVSQGIVEDLSEPLSGFTTAVDGQSEPWYPDVYCDSDTWEDDDDPGYHRQPIEDEEWFLTNEIDYPSDDERSRQHTDKALLSGVRQSKKLDEDDRRFVEEESYFSGEEYYRQQLTKKEIQRLQMSESIEQIKLLKDTCSSVYLSKNDDEALNLSRRNDEGNVYDDNLYGFSRGNDDDALNLSRGNDDGNDYDGDLCDSAETNLLASQPVWKGFMYQADQLGQSDLISSGNWPDERRGDNIDDENHGSVRSGPLINSDAADIGSEVRDSLLGGSSEGDAESLRYQALSAYGSAFGNFKPEDFLGAKEGKHFEVKSAPVRHLDDAEDHDAILQYYSEEWSHAKEPGQRDGTRRSNLGKDQSKGRHSSVCNSKAGQGNGGFVFEGFSFPSSSSTCDVPASRTGSGKSLWSNRESIAHGAEIDGLGSGLAGPDDTLAAWKRKSNNSSPGVGSSEDNLPKATLLNCSSGSPHSTDEYVSIEAQEDSDVGRLNGSFLPKANEPLAQGDEEAVVAQDELRTLGPDEYQYEIFDLRIIHRKNRTGFEEDKDFPILINSVIAGRYHVTEYLGSAAFSKAIQAHDLQTGLDVCMKIIKNNKDFFDQSLDEIKLLKFVNKHDPADKYHILRLYDYFYHREHLFIVCELLRANLYEFHKFNRESGGEVYFTMPRLQSITVQCLEALDFLHRLGIIHCDLKPENILVKSYSRCEIKIIDLGSSCFQTDHFCSYVQSRSYRAPEVILGLPYDQKIDIWSLGCILAELCTGNVLFQNDSLATLLARVGGILGPLDAEVLAKGRDTYKYFTKNHVLYERNQETDQLEYLIPKKTSLSHRLPMGDQGFAEFVGFLLQSNPSKRPTASEALQHPWLSYPYEPISS